jgi:hypothetical protein
MERHRTIRDVDVFGWRSIGDRAQSEASKDEEEPRGLHWRQEGMSRRDLIMVGARPQCRPKSPQGFAAAPE